VPKARRGEVWLVDLGMAAKARPTLFVSVPFLDNERALYAVIPHTTATRGGRFEIVIDVPWLKAGAFDVQGLRNIPGTVFIRLLGTLNQGQIDRITAAAKTWLGII
jgi:mRNA interferase MazF